MLVINRLIGAQCSQELLVACAGSGRHKRPKSLSQLDRYRSHASGAGMNKHAVARFRPALRNQRLPRTQRSNRQRCSFFVGQIRGLAGHRFFRNDGKFGVGPSIGFAYGAVFAPINLVAGLE